MDAARWDELAVLFEQALALPPGERPTFLDDACGDDAGLRARLDALLASHGEAQGYFDDLAGSVFAPAPARPAAMLPGDAGRIGPYQVIEKLGEGGMGVVYKAHDTRLDRFVALKFLPPQLSADAQAKQRFIAEAQAASALDHANICTVYEIGETDDGRLFIAMAFYEGQTLRQKIQRGPLPAAEALDLAIQIARGLARAHGRGIVHRDVKPANVIVTDDEEAKIVDFGLAKIVDLQLTRTGTTMGTVAYMSPEQARGEPVDARTDLWSLGVVLYEMLTGQRPFRGDHAEAITYAVLHRDPAPLTTHDPDLPPELERIVATCLKKERAQRYPQADELLADLHLVRQDVGTDAVALLRERRAAAQTARQRRRRTAFAAGGVLLALLLAAALPSVRQAALRMVGVESLPAEKHLVVLPVMEAGAAPSDRDFADGLVETLVNSLERMGRRQPAFWVVPGDRVRQASITRPAEARRLGANLAVTVAVERLHDEASIVLNLVDTKTDRTVRSQAVVRSATQLAALRDDVTLALADMLEVNLTPSDHRTLLAGGTAEPGAYEFYVQGLGRLEHFGELRNIDAAIGLFQQALTHDAAFALADAGLGEAYWRKFDTTGDVQWAGKAADHCNRALELDDQLAPVYVTRGLVFRGTGEYGSALGSFQVALSLDSTNVTTYRELAKTYQALDRLDDAEKTYKRAIEVKPDYFLAHNSLGVFYYVQARYEEAIAPFETAIRLNPLYAQGKANLGATYFELDRRQEAFELFWQAARLEPSDAIYANLGTQLFYEKQYTEAAQAYEEALKLQDTDYRVWGYLGSAYYWAGERQQARQAFERAARMAEAVLEVNLRNPEVLASLASNYAYLDERKKTLSFIAQLPPLASLEPEDALTIAEAYEQLGERDLALTWIEMTLEKGYSLVEINSLPGLEDLRSDERFRQILRRSREDAS